MESKKWKCLKCGNENFEQDEMRATGGALSKILDIQNKKFTTITCTKCKYTEFYKGNSSTLGNILDFFTS